MSCCTEPRPRQARSAEKEQGWTFLLTEHQRGNQSREGGQELGSGLHMPLDRSHLCCTAPPGNKESTGARGTGRKKQEKQAPAARLEI
jgi:hypothetical protein